VIFGKKSFFFEEKFFPQENYLGKVVKVENFNVETLFGHGVLRSKMKLELKVDRG